MVTLTRRTLFSTVASGAAAVLSQGGCRSRLEPVEGAELPRPTPAQLAWQDFELGLLYCLDLPVFQPGGWKAVKETFEPL